MQLEVTLTSNLFATVSELHLVSSSNVRGKMCNLYKSDFKAKFHHIQWNSLLVYLFAVLKIILPESSGIINECSVWGFVHTQRDANEFFVFSI